MKMSFCADITPESARRKAPNYLPELLKSEVGYYL